jgi:hypothetical protein
MRITDGNTLEQLDNPKIATRIAEATYVATLREG